MSYHKLDISLLDVPPYLRGVAITVQPQMPPPSVLRQIIAWIRGFTR